MVSIHQSAFIKALSENHDVTLVAEEDMMAQRIKDGWSIPQMGKARVVIKPGDNEIERLLSMPNTKQVFSGIDAFPLVYRVFKMAVKKRLDISVMMEPYQWQGFKGFIRRGKYALHALRYAKHINHIFATGDLGVHAFLKAGFPKSKLHQWGYFTEQIIENNLIQNDTVKVIFVGSIDERKNIISLVKVANNCSDLYGEFLIIGGGNLENELRNEIACNPKIHFLGRIKNEEVASIIAGCDLLVLPSIFDGWGAVVNEALSQGTRVLCSDKCGASSLLDGTVRGGVFSLNNPNSLEEQFRFWLKKGPISVDTRKEIIEWSLKSISGTSAKDYFLSNFTSQPIDTPWITPPPLNLIFVGRLDDNKNILTVLEIFEGIKDSIGQFTIVGDGNLNERVRQYTDKYTNVVMTGNLTNKTVLKLISLNDILILPSKYDGWGAVVNEALSVGTRVLCSETCGSSILLDGNDRGESFTPTTMKDVLVKWIDKGPINQQDRKSIIAWSMNRISGTVSANYFIDCFKDINAQAPWIERSND